MNNDHYVPGVCNIGPEEISQRKLFGWVGLIVTLLLWALFYVLHTSALWRLFLFFPAMASAAGFIQAYSHFCAAFGMKGFYNFSKEAGKTDTVAQAEYRAEDKKKATKIVAFSVLVGIVVALAAYFIV